MNSIDIIKQELINQKTALEERGFTVTTEHTNPSPTEITNAINNIDLDFTQVTATPQDVSEGKTYYGKDGTLQTGTLEPGLAMLSELAMGIITGTGYNEVYIPTDSEYTMVRSSAYFSYNVSSSGPIFYKHNLTIPSNITTIGDRCFCGANLTGKLTVPSTCTSIGAYAFQYTNIDEVEIAAQSLTTASYICGSCPNLKKAVINEPCTSLGASAFYSCSALEEVYIPATLTSISTSSFNKCTNMVFVKFACSTPPTITANTFYSTSNVVYIVPYQAYDTYLNATNYQYHPRGQYGFGEFNTGDIFPTSITGYTLTWHASIDDAKGNSNHLSTCPNTGTYYARFTAV